MDDPDGKPLPYIHTIRYRIVEDGEVALLMAANRDYVQSDSSGAGETRVFPEQGFSYWYVACDRPRVTDRSLWETRVCDGARMDATIHRFGGVVGHIVLTDPRYYFYAKAWANWIGCHSGVID